MSAKVGERQRRNRNGGVQWSHFTETCSQRLCGVCSTVPQAVQVGLGAPQAGTGLRVRADWLGSISSHTGGLKHSPVALCAGHCFGSRHLAPRQHRPRIFRYQVGSRRRRRRRRRRARDDEDEKEEKEDEEDEEQGGGVSGLLSSPELSTRCDAVSTSCAAPRPALSESALRESAT
ncbi:Protein of unknown function [Gryllus bimaculatus]|nr:Protein of unknown function [Gryllus bimaculatus]